MKNKYIVFLILVVIIIGSFFIFKKIYTNQGNNDTEPNSNNVNIEELNVMSSHNQYVLVRENKYSELETYSIYKNNQDNYYKRQFSFPDGEIIESRFVCWTDDKIYILGYNPASYDLSNGNIIDTGDLNKMLNNTTGNIDRIIGIDNAFIYYTYSFNAEHYYAKIDFNLNNVTIIQKENLPTKLSN